MYASYCHHCDKHWNNVTQNCPQCGAPDPNAQYTGEENHEDPMQKESQFSSHVADAMKVGAALAIAGEANSLITNGAKLALISAGVPPKALESALFEKGTPLVSALLVLYAAERFPDLVPKAEFVTKAAQLALQEATKDSLAPMLQHASPMLMALAASGEKMAKLEAGDADNFETRINDDDEDAHGVQDATFEVRES